jgi:hypothetical protein
MLTTITMSLVAISMFAQAIIQDPNTVPDKDQVLKAIDRFIATPAPGEDAKLINQFAEKSDECLVHVSQEVLPWTTHEPPYKYQRALLTAFIAGNIKSQLASGKVADDSYAGVLATIKVYERLRERDAEFKAPEIDEYIAKEKRGELKAWVEAKAKEAAGRHDQQSPSTQKTKDK